MILLRRPAEPPDFAERTREPYQRVEEAIAAGETPTFEPPVWGDYKAVFSKAQHGKCAYCEAFILAVSTGQVDHFRPKGAVCELGADPATWGREILGASNVEERQTRPLSDRGYWWLAYTWSNLCFVCERCNTGWKRTIFPVAEEPRCLPPQRGVEETCLLLDPYGETNPGEHLRFDDLGQVETVPGSRMGSETIRTLGLDRENLRNSRQPMAQDSFQLIRTIKSSEPGSGEWREALHDLIHLGDRRRPHAGMVRIRAEHYLGLLWEELEEFRSPTIG